MLAPVAAPAMLAADAAAMPADDVSAPVLAAGADSAAVAPAGGDARHGQQQQQQDGRDGGRRGRGRRRRRRGGSGGGGGAGGGIRGGMGGGLPDSKFASPAEAAADDDDSLDAEAGDEMLDASPDATPALLASPADPYVAPLPPPYVSRPLVAEEPEPFVLPGESIAKYRRSEEPYTPPMPPPASLRRVEAPPPPPAPRAAEVVIERREEREEPVAAAAEPPPPPPAPPVEVVAPEPVSETDRDEQVEVRELVVDHVEEHQAALEAAEAAADAAQEEAEAALEAEAAGEVIDVDDEESEIEAGAADMDSTGEAEEDDAPAVEAVETEVVSGEAGVRQDQPTARYIQRRDRERGGRNRRGGRRDGNGPRTGGGERYDAVPRSTDAATVATGEAREPMPAAPAVAVPRGDRDRGGPPRERSGDRPPIPSISDLLKEGQEIIVQIYKEPLGQKGARITSHVAMPGRYVVFMPTADHHGVSRKLGNDEERQRLKRIVQANSQGMVGGFIVRTAGEGKPEAEIAADMSNLYNQWLDIRKKAEKRRAPCLLHSDLELVTRTLRDQVNDQYKAIWVDSEEMYETIVSFLEVFQPPLVSRVKLYSREAPIFDTFNITAELEKALRPKVWLKSGGYIVINQTEALVAIDINTGKYVGKSNRLEDTIVKTNVEAVKEIVRQIRLRDLGGIIVVDFIDMDERKNRQKVMQALEEAMSMDRAPYKILQFNDFGLVAITRRRVKQSLERALCSPCPTCEGAGSVKSVQTVLGEILTEAHKIRPGLEGKDVMLRVNPEVAKVIKSDSANYMVELEEILGRVVIVKSDPLLHPEKFDLA